jgi:hypothetical protein
MASVWSRVGTSSQVVLGAFGSFVACAKEDQLAAPPVLSAYSLRDANRTPRGSRGLSLIVLRERCVIASGPDARSIRDDSKMIDVPRWLEFLEARLVGEQGHGLVGHS